jgi:dTDP-4-dehydrorhamnose 3,5-epimerase
MAWIPTNFDSVWVFEPTIWPDDRGYFFESFNASKLPDEIKKVSFVQDNEAKSTKGVLRGLHYQLPPFAQSKLVRCTQGEVLDVIVDVRQNSKTYGQQLSVILNDITKKQLFVPHGFAHGYIVLSEEAIFSYKCDQFYQPGCEGGIIYNDPKLGIDWILDSSEFIFSEKDLKLPTFEHHSKFEAK